MTAILQRLAGLGPSPRHDKLGDGVQHDQKTCSRSGAQEVAPRERRHSATCDSLETQSSGLLLPSTLGPRSRSVELSLYFSHKDGCFVHADSWASSIESLGLPSLSQHKSLLSALHGEGPISLEAFLQVLPSVLQNCSTRNMKKCEPVKHLLSRLDIPGETWKEYAFWDKDKLYTRNLVSTDGQTYTLLLLCWNPGKESPIHDHPCEGCWVKTLQGEVKETLYEVDGRQQLSPFQETRFHTGELSYIEDSMGFHKIGNPASLGAVTLHLYIPPPTSCRIWLGQRTKACESMTVPVCYFSAYGRRVEASETPTSSISGPIAAPAPPEGRPPCVPGAGAVVGSPGNDMGLQPFPGKYA